MQVGKSLGNIVGAPDDQLAIDARGRVLLHMLARSRIGADRVDRVLVLGVHLRVGRVGGLGTAVHAAESVAGREPDLGLLHGGVQGSDKGPGKVVSKEKR